MEMITFLHYIKEVLERTDTLKSFIYDDLPEVLNQVGVVENDTEKGLLVVRQKNPHSYEEIMMMNSALQTAYQHFYSKASSKLFKFIPQLYSFRADRYRRACICALLIAICYRYLNEWQIMSQHSQLALESFNFYSKALIDGVYTYEYTINNLRLFISPILGESPSVQAKGLIKNEREELFIVLSRLAEN